MRNLYLLMAAFFLPTQLFAQSLNLQGAYQCTGYFFHPSAPRVINQSKPIYQVAPNRYQVALADLGVSNLFFQFDVDANNNLVNWVAIGSTPASPQSGFMTSDNPGAFTFYPGGTSGYVHSVYNNKYNPVTKTFYMHYGYQTGATGQNQFQRQVYEQYVLTAGQPLISSAGPTAISYGNFFSLTGKNFTNANFYFQANTGVLVDSFRVLSDSVMRVWPGGGVNATTRFYVSNSYAYDSTLPLTYTAPVSTNNTWQYAGPAGFAATRSRYGINMAITKTNIPHVAFVDSVGKAKVMKFTASTNTWSAVGGTISDGICSHINIKMDNNNIPYIAYIDSLNGSRITVKKLSGTSWVTVGTPGFTKLVKFSNQNTVPLAIDGANVPYVLSSDSVIGIYQLAPMRFNSATNSWMFMGVATNEYNDYYTLDIDKNTNAVYVSYGSPVNYQVSVLKFVAGSTTSLVGSPEFTGSPIGSFYSTVRVDKNGNPFLIAQDDDTHERLSLYSFNGTSWSRSGGFRFSKGHSYAPSMTFDKNNLPVVAFTDATYNGQGSVMQKTNSGAWVLTGDRGFQPGNNLANSLAIDTTNTPYLAFIDYKNNNRISVMRLRATLSASIREFTPTASLAGGTITIKGVGFTGARGVKFNTTAATSYTVVNDTMITAVVGTGATGAVNVTTATGGVVSKDGFVLCTTPSIATAITGQIDVCPFIGGDTMSAPLLYTIRRVANVNVYNWTVPAGAVIVSGQGDTGIFIRFSRTFVSGTISVVAVNRCGQTSLAKTLIVYKRVAATPGTIQKEFFPSTTAVTNVCGLTSEIYKIRKVLYATSYDWRLRLGTGATLQHLNPLGENDTAIRVVFSQSLLRDTISVASISACSVGAPTYVHVSASGTVAGGNGQGSATNQLYNPRAIFVDKAGNMFIADHLNHRIVRWAPGATSGVVVAGGNGQGIALNQLNAPSGVFVDKSGNVFISDNNNHRVMRWAPGATTGVVVAGGNGLGTAANQLNYPGGVAVDTLGRIYVSDNSNHRIMRWQSGVSFGTLVAGGNGVGVAANQIVYPHGIFLDAAMNIYITEDNNRIQKWAPGATSGVTVAGGNGVGSAANQFDYPYAVSVDQSGAIYVADVGNHRVQKFVSGSTEGKSIAGGNGNGTAINQLALPTGVALDSSGAVYISDNNNHRVQKLLPFTPASITTPARTLAITTQLTPPTVSGITGSTTPCIGNQLTYTATAPTPTATQAPIGMYRWTKPNFTTIVSANADSSTITLSYNTGFTGGTISAKAHSRCGVLGAVKTITLQYLTPTPTNIISRTGTYNACIGDTITYTAVVPLPTTTQRAANVYRWTRPSNTQVLSTSADSSRILLKFNTGYVGGALSVRGQTICGVLGTAKSVTLTHTACPTGTANQPFAKTTSHDFASEYQLFPNPSMDQFVLQGNNSFQPIQIDVINNNGAMIKHYTLSGSRIVFGRDLPKGAYMLRIQSEKDVRMQKIIKQ